MLPADGFMTPAISRRSVNLPQSDGPTGGQKFASARLKGGWTDNMRPLFIGKGIEQTTNFNCGFIRYNVGFFKQGNPDKAVQSEYQKQNGRDAGGHSGAIAAPFGGGHKRLMPLCRPMSSMPMTASQPMMLMPINF